MRTPLLLAAFWACAPLAAHADAEIPANFEAAIQREAAADRDYSTILEGMHKRMKHQQARPRQDGESRVLRFKRAMDKVGVPEEKRVNVLLRLEKLGELAPSSQPLDDVAAIIKVNDALEFLEKGRRPAMAPIGEAEMNGHLKDLIEQMQSEQPLAVKGDTRLIPEACRVGMNSVAEFNRCLELVSNGQVPTNRQILHKYQSGSHSVGADGPKHELNAEGVE
jgi:hypothetical protein